MSEPLRDVEMEARPKTLRRLLKRLSAAGTDGTWVGEVASARSDLATLAPPLLAIAEVVVRWRQCDLDPGECQCDGLDRDDLADFADVLIDLLDEVDR